MTSYNQIAGRSLDRIAALSDGVFAIAMTLIVLGIRVPALGAAATDHDLWDELGKLAPQFVTYLLSFLTLGIFWKRSRRSFTTSAGRTATWRGSTSPTWRAWPSCRSRRRCWPTTSAFGSR
jgi:uncharacterized membrane protein